MIAVRMVGRGSSSSCVACQDETRTLWEQWVACTIHGAVDMSSVCGEEEAAGLASYPRGQMDGGTWSRLEKMSQSSRWRVASSRARST